MVTHETEDVAESVILRILSHAADFFQDRQIISPAINDVAKEDNNGLGTFNTLDKR